MKKALFPVLALVLALGLALPMALPVGANSALPTVNWLPPLTNQTDFQLKDGSTLPIKFTLNDPATGAFVEDTSVRVDLNKVLFRDDFERDQVGADWTPVSGHANIVTDAGDRVYQHVGGSYVGAVTAVAGSAHWENYLLQVDVKKVEGTYFNLAFRYQDESNYYMLEGGSSVGSQIKLYKRVHGTFTLLEAVDQPTVNGTWYHYKIQVCGTAIKVWLDGVPKLGNEDSSLTKGRIGIGGYASTVDFDDVMVLSVPAAKPFDYGDGGDNVRIAYDTVFADNFADGNYDGWSPVTGDTSWSVVGGRLYTDGSIAQARIFADSTMCYRDYSFEADAKLVTGRGYALNFRTTDSERFYAFQYQAGTGTLSLRLYQFTDFPEGADVALLVPYSTNNDWHHLKVVVIGNHIRCYVDGDIVFDVSDTAAPAPLQGGIGFRAWANSTAEFDNVVVQVPQYIANLHTTDLLGATGIYAITVWSGDNELRPSYIVDLTNSVQGVGRGKGKA